MGYQPLANSLLKDKKEKGDLYPLEMNYCDKCHNCQLSVAVDPKKCFQNTYILPLHPKALETIFKQQQKYIKNFNLNPKKSYIIDIGSNDGIGLKPFKDLNFKKIQGIEPAKNLAKLSNQNKIKTFNGFLTKKNLKEIPKNADLVMASNVFAHSDNLKE